MRTFPLSLSSSPSLSLFRSTLGPRRPASLPRGIQVLLHLKQWIWRDRLTSIGLQTHLFSWLRGCSCHPTYAEKKKKSHLDSGNQTLFFKLYPPVSCSERLHHDQVLSKDTERAALTDSRTAIEVLQQKPLRNYLSPTVPWTNCTTVYGCLSPSTTLTLEIKKVCNFSFGVRQDYQNWLSIFAVRSWRKFACQGSGSCDHTQECQCIYSGVWDTGLSGQGTGTTNQPASHPPADSPLTASSPLGTGTGTGGGEEDQSVSESGLNLISEIIIYV